MSNDGSVLYTWLSQAGLEKYFPAFSSNGVSESNFTTLSMQDYSRFGITGMADRKRLFQLIQVVKRNAAQAENDEPEPRMVSARSDGEVEPEPHIVLEKRPVSASGVEIAPPRRMASKIRVILRKRPLAKKEVAMKNNKDIVNVNSNDTLTIQVPKVTVDLTEYIDEHKFVFDEVFSGESDNEHVYERTASPLVEFVLNKGKATVFCFGQTGSGKTHTLLGKKGESGLYLLAADELFRKKGKRLSLWVSFYEIYACKLYDLLNKRKKLFAREDGKSRVHIVGLQEHEVETVDQLMELIDYGNSVRATGSTGANADSSRSHAILQVVVKDESTHRTHGKFSFIDLAGSERGADTTNNDRQTRMEGAEINKSLLALKECIRALDLDHRHIPFRGSKLTEVLRDSFIGNSRTCMIATISPAALNSEHTLNTLRYADRVKSLSGEAKKGPRDYAGRTASEISSSNEARQRAAERMRNRGGRQHRKRDDVMPSARRGGGVMPIHRKKPPLAPVSSVPPQTSEPDLEILSSEDERQEGIVSSESSEVVDQFLSEDDEGEVEENNGEDDLERAHEDLINTILEEEEDLIGAHRQEIDIIMGLMRQEMKLLSDVDQPGSAIDTYVTGLEDVLAKKAVEIQSLRDRLGEFQKHLREEEILSRSFRRNDNL